MGHKEEAGKVLRVREEYTNLVMSWGTEDCSLCRKDSLHNLIVFVVVGAVMESSLASYLQNVLCSVGVCSWRSFPSQV